jgi:hypothetical protein
LCHVELVVAFGCEPQAFHAVAVVHRVSPNQSVACSPTAVRRSHCVQ